MTSYLLTISVDTLSGKQENTQSEIRNEYFESEFIRFESLSTPKSPQLLSEVPPETEFNALESQKLLLQHEATDSAQKIVINATRMTLKFAQSI